MIFAAATGNLEGVILLVEALGADLRPAMPFGGNHSAFFPDKEPSAAGMAAYGGHLSCFIYLN